MKSLLKFSNLLLASSIMLTANAQTNPPAITKQKIKVSNDLNIFYQEAGSGQPILFIPGFTMPSDVYKAQIEFFSPNYRVIAMDPRGQGQSTITQENNTYTQHGIDLANFIDTLKLKNIILVAWSWGCNDAYSYVRLKGISNLNAFVCIDASPKSSGTKNEWAFAEYSEWGKALIQPFLYNREKFTATWVQAMAERKLTPTESKELVQQSLRLPTYAAIELAADAIYADYRPEAIELDKNNIPTLDFVSQGLSDRARIWLQANAPHAKLIVIPKHLTFWEHPAQFNTYLNDFLNSIKSKKE